MNSEENNGSGIGLGIAQVNSEDSAEVPRWQPPPPTEPASAEDRTDAQQPTSHATREGSDGKSGIEKSKLIMLGGGLLAAVLFLALTSLINHSSTAKKATEKQLSHPAQQQASSPSKGSVTPLMETVQTNAQENTSGQVHPGDIKRTGTPAPGAGDNLGLRRLQSHVQGARRAQTHWVPSHRSPTRSRSGRNRNRMAKSATHRLFKRSKRRTL